MRRIELGLVSSTLLLPVAVFLVATGLASDFMDLNEFVYHKYAGYAAVGLAAIHVLAHWPQLKGYWKKKLGRGAVSRPPAHEHRRAMEGKAEREPTAPQPEDGSRRQHALPFHFGSGLTRRRFLELTGAGAAGLLVGWLTRSGWPAQAIQTAGQDLGLLYHRWSTPGYGDALSAVLNWGRQPPLYKDYAWAERVPLPSVETPPAMPLAETIARRRSLRDYADRALTLAELSWLLYCASGITAPASGLRAAPSAGAQFPIETYVAANRVEGLAPGLYHYAVKQHALHRVREGELAAAIMRAGLGQEFLAQAGVVFVLTAIFQRLRWRYRERTYRYALLEAGHIGQNLYLAAEAAGLGACAVGAYFDDQLNQLLEVDGEEEAALYVLAVGPR